LKVINTVSILWNPSSEQDFCTSNKGATATPPFRKPTNAVYRLFKAYEYADRILIETIRTQTGKVNNVNQPGNSYQAHLSVPSVLSDFVRKPSFYIASASFNTGQVFFVQVFFRHLALIISSGILCHLI
jgi:hypothetical protein